MSNLFSMTLLIIHVAKSRIILHLTKSDNIWQYWTQITRTLLDSNLYIQYSMFTLTEFYICQLITYQVQYTLDNSTVELFLNVAIT